MPLSVELRHLLLGCVYYEHYAPSYPFFVHSNIIYRGYITLDDFLNRYFRSIVLTILLNVVLMMICYHRFQPPSDVYLFSEKLQLLYLLVTVAAKPTGSRNLNVSIDLFCKIKDGFLKYYPLKSKIWDDVWMVKV